MIQNKVFLNPDGIIEAQVVGDQTYDTMIDSGELAAPIIAELMTKQQPVLVLVDLTEEGARSTGSNRAVLKIFDGIPYQKMAVYGGSVARRVIADQIAKAAGRGRNTAMFGSRAEAISWLQNPPT